MTKLQTETSKKKDSRRIDIGLIIFNIQFRGNALINSDMHNCIIFVFVHENLYINRYT